MGNALRDIAQVTERQMRIPFLITARLSSVRLPTKLLLELDGTEVVSKIIERALKVFSKEDVIVCTSPLSSDDPLQAIAHRHGIGVSRGHPEDILLRLCGACRETDAYGFVGITGENPIFQLDHCLRIRDEIAKGRDLVRYGGLPMGCSPYGMGRAVLETVVALKEEEDTGYWGAFLNRPEAFDVLMIEAEAALRMPEVRLTVDYPEDLQLMRAIFKILPGMPDLRNVIALLKSHPDLLAINAMRKQSDMPPEMKQRIDNWFAANMQRLKEQRMVRAAQLSRGTTTTIGESGS